MASMCSWGMLEVCEQVSHVQKVHIPHSTQRSSAFLSHFLLHVGKQHSSLLLGCFVESKKLVEGMANAVLMFLLPSFPFFVTVFFGAGFDTAVLLLRTSFGLGNSNNLELEAPRCKLYSSINLLCKSHAPGNEKGKLSSADYLKESSFRSLYCDIELTLVSIKGFLASTKSSKS